jgi:hypothetical protein
MTMRDVSALSAVPQSLRMQLWHDVDNAVEGLRACHEQLESQLDDPAALKVTLARIKEIQAQLDQLGR